ncbi:MAG TPA: ABC transporter ATP-binding protein [Chitinophagaceae bacterium]|nr:ABC transporter ATP-binding protein [Chitinophagaceae bacterium]
MIRIDHISKRFKRLQVLDNVSASFTKGQVISLIGPNGSGKTTLIKTILGMVKADSGEIYVNDTAVNSDFEYRKNIGYMPQIGRYPDNLKIGQLFKMLKHIRSKEDRELDHDLVEKFNLPALYDKPMRTLSGGTRQKVSACLAFLFNPDVLILDEPTAGLDPLSSEILKEKVIEEKNKNKLILITSHVLSDLDELTTHIMYLQEGKLRFLKDMQTLQDETGETRLGKAIARIMKSEKLNLLSGDDKVMVKK